MLKYPVTILFLLLTVSQTFSKWCVIAEFRINRDYIARNLCVNRLRPCCCCKGKCYLNKKLAEDQSRKDTPGKDAQHEEITWQVLPMDRLLPDPVVIVLHRSYATRHLIGESQEYFPSFFAPPRETTFIS